jgi:hypothetical protein
MLIVQKSSINNQQFLFNGKNLNLNFFFINLFKKIFFEQSAFFIFFKVQMESIKNWF